MSKHFQWYPSGEGSDQVIPWNAKYAFPSQANKASKITPRIPPKNGSTFLPGNVIRLELPAQGYLNPVNTTLEFDLTLQGYADDSVALVRLQNNVQSTIARLRIMYGSTPLEDIINYNVIVRSLTEWTSTNNSNSFDQTSIADGVGGYTLGNDRIGLPGLVNVRQAYIQGLDGTASGTPAAFTAGQGLGNVPNTTLGQGVSAQAARYSTKRYQINLAAGLFSQDKLIPTKFMASQFAIEITLEQPAACIFAVPSVSNPGTPPTYSISNVNLIPEIIEFDASYDLGIMEGLAQGGVPIKYATWHTYIFNIGGSSKASLQVQERSRSVKALFGVQRRNPAKYDSDSHATFFDTAQNSSMQEYQYRIGGRYFPASPVLLSLTPGSTTSNGGAEAFLELQKALNVVGDYRLSTSCNVTRWGMGASSAAQTMGYSTSTIHNELDYCSSVASYGTGGAPLLSTVSDPHPSTGNGFCGSLGSACFTAAIDLETSSGLEISGLNAEEQSDISFNASWSQPQATNFVYEIYAYVDQMIILRENNMLEVIQ